MLKFFQDLSISNKLATVFLFLLFMMGVGGSVGLYNAGQLAKVTETLYLDSFKRTEVLSSVENEFLSARHEIFLHTIIPDAASKSFLEASIDEHITKIDRLLLEYKGMGISRGQEELYANLRDNFSIYWHIHANAEELSRKGKREMALSIIRMEGNKSFIDTINSLRQLIKEEKARAYSAYMESDFFAKVIIAVTFAFTLLAIVVAGGLWVMLIRSIVRPILSIEDSAKKIGQGVLKERVPVMTKDEIGSLAIEFNKMAEGLENSYTMLENEVEKRTEELRLATDDATRKKKELEMANIELREASRMKSQFLANVSHELRTPLNSIIGFSELLGERAFGDLNDRQVQYVEFIHSSGEHLLQLINNILDLSKIEAGRMELSAEVFSIMEALGEVLGIVRPMAHKRSVVIEARTAPASPKIMADKAKFKQIMLNLLSNAVKFNVEGGKVDIDWDIMEEPSRMEMVRYIVFKIKDTGIGIKDEDKTKLFKEFEQIDSSITREYGGTGLGLVLTKRLVELHNGRIWVESVYGKGSSFYVKMPQGTEEIDLPVYSPAQAPQQGTRGLPLILLAGESQDINRLLEIYLSDGSYEIAAASDGLDLLRKAQEQKPFAIIMGVAIPKKDGWDVLKELKSTDETMHIPVIIVSSTDNKDLGLSLGAYEYMEKPINRERLIGLLARLKGGPRAKPGPSKVLLVGDGPDSFKGAAEGLEREGYSVFRSPAGREAEALAGECDPDCVVVQVGNEREKAFESVKRLGNGPSGRKRPVILCSSTGLNPAEHESIGTNVRTLISDNGISTESLLKEIRLSESA